MTVWVSQHQKGKTILDFNEVRDDGVAVASAEPHANHLHLAPISNVLKLSFDIFTLWDILSSVCCWNAACVTVGLSGKWYLSVSGVDLNIWMTILLLQWTLGICVWFWDGRTLLYVTHLMWVCLLTGHSSVDVIVAAQQISSATFEQAKQQQIPVVSHEWVVQCLIAGRRLSVTGHDKYIPKPAWPFSAWQLLQLPSFNESWPCFVMTNMCWIALHIWVIWQIATSW